MMIDDVLELFTEFMREGGRARNLLSRRVMSPRRGGMERCVTDIGRGSTLLDGRVGMHLKARPEEKAMYVAGDLCVRDGAPEEHKGRTMNTEH